LPIGFKGTRTGRTLYRGRMARIAKAFSVVLPCLFGKKPYKPRAPSILVGS
jgi:hypothetical protein